MDRIDAVTLYGPNPNETMADSLYFSSTTDYGAATWTRRVYYVNEDYDAGEQIAAMITTYFSTANTWVKIGYVQVCGIKE